MHTKKRWVIATVVVPLGLMTALASATDSADRPINTNAFRQHVTLAGVRFHQSVLQLLANNNGNTRLAGTSGYDASAAYMMSRAYGAGYEVSSQPFDFNLFFQRTPPLFARVDPLPETFVEGDDYVVMTHSGNTPGSAPFTGPLWAVDISPSTNLADLSSGCQAADFAGFPAGAIALMQRGGCLFFQKYQNALGAGASGIVVYNDGTSSDRRDVLGAVLSVDPQDKPAFFTSFDIGDELRNGVLNGNTGVVVNLKVDAADEERTTSNVIAETPSGDPNHVIVVGAHLDSVQRGPGINDNGSGSSALLEIAEKLLDKKYKIRNKVRFIWFGAEEQGGLGSNTYVASLSPAQVGAIAAMLNFDMLGSPNYGRFVYDGNNDAFPIGSSARGSAVLEAPPGSGEIERVLRDYFDAENLAIDAAPFNVRSDYYAFLNADIPVGGFDSGWGERKTPAQAALFGGTAGERFDPCYHMSCDTFSNNNDTVLDQLTDAAAHAVLVFANRNFDTNPL